MSQPATPGHDADDENDEDAATVLMSNSDVNDLLGDLRDERSEEGEGPVETESQAAPFHMLGQETPAPLQRATLDGHDTLQPPIAAQPPPLSAPEEASSGWLMWTVAGAAVLLGAGILGYAYLV